MPEAGIAHGCGVTSDHAVMCWGDNDQGQLGNGSTKSSSTPVGVAGLSSPVATLATGGGHTCAVLTDGSVACWGWNSDGQLGDGTTRSRQAPVPVSGLSGVTVLAAGFQHTCARTEAGAVQCWGSNQYGQLGNGSHTPVSPSPTPVAAWGGAPAWLEENSAFPTGDSGVLWSGSDTAGSAKVVNGRYEVRKKASGDWLFWALGENDALRAVSMTIDGDSLSGKARPYYGMACMAPHGSGYPASSYNLFINSDGILGMVKWAKGKYTTLKFAKVPHFNPNKPPTVIFGCEQRGSEVYLSADVENDQLYTTRDTHPLKPGSAALLIGQFTKGTGVLRFDEIDTVGEVASNA